MYERHAQLVRDAGALAELPIHLQALALERAWRGDLPGARQLTAEAESISTSTGNQVPPFALLRIVALPGVRSRGLPLHRRRRPTRPRHEGSDTLVKVAHWTRRGARHRASGATRRRQRQPERPSTNGVLPWAVDVGAVRAGSRPLRASATRSAAHVALDALAVITQPAGSSLRARHRGALSGAARRWR